MRTMSHLLFGLLYLGVAAELVVAYVLFRLLRMPNFKTEWSLAFWELVFIEIVSGMFIARELWLGGRLNLITSMSLVFLACVSGYVLTRILA